MKRALSISAIVAILGALTVVFSFRNKHFVTRVVDGDTIEVSGYDENIRLMGIDTAEDGECYRFINKRLLELGAGEFFYDSVNLKHQRELISVAEAARESQLGFWKTCGPCIIKGNYDIQGKRFYHMPEFRHYSQVVVNLDKADRWFCNEKEAIDAGFVRARE